VRRFGVGVRRNGVGAGRFGVGVRRNGVGAGRFGVGVRRFRFGTRRFDHCVRRFARRVARFAATRPTTMTAITEHRERADTVERRITTWLAVS